MNGSPWRIVLLLIVLIAAAAAGYHFWPGIGDEVQASPTAPVPDWPGNDPGVVFSAPAVVEPVTRSLSITSPITGPIQQIVVSSGDDIEKGQVLFELSNIVEAARVRHRESLVAAAQARLKKLEAWERDEDRRIAKAQWEQAGASMELAKFERDRVRQLAERKAVSDREVFNAEQSFIAANAAANAAKARYDLTQAGPRPEDLAIHRAAVADAEAQLAIAEAVFEKTIVRSPIDGMVIYRHLEPGEMITPDIPQPVLTIGDCSVINLRADVDESNLSLVTVGQPVFATADAFGSRRFYGRVVHVERTLGRKNFRTFKPTEKADTKILEVVIELDDGSDLPIDLQMTVWFKEAAAPESDADTSEAPPSDDASVGESPSQSAATQPSVPEPSDASTAD